MFLGQDLQRLAVFVNAIAHGADQRRIGGDLHGFLLMRGQASPDFAVEVHVGVDDHLMQALQIVVLKDLIEAEGQVRFGAAPFGGVDDAFLQRRQNVAAAHGNRGNTDVLIGLAGNSRRRAEA